MPHMVINPAEETRRKKEKDFVKTKFNHMRQHKSQNDIQDIG